MSEPTKAKYITEIITVIFKEVLSKPVAGKDCSITGKFPRNRITSGAFRGVAVSCINVR